MISPRESPDYLQTSTAGALALGFEKGSFLRGACLHCLNVLLTYADGCRANCAFCGLGRERVHDGLVQDKTFIRVNWPVYSTDSIVRALQDPERNYIRRTCISMITHARAKQDTLELVKKFLPTGQELSVLLSPTIINVSWLKELESSGVDKVGIAIDAATEEIFDRLRGKGVNGPHSWDRYWRTLQDAIKIFGGERTGVHLIIGIGETERDAIRTIQKVHDMGSRTHLFSFFPEKGSALENHPQPGIGTYRRIQLAREAIERDMVHFYDLEFNDAGQIVGFGVPGEIIDGLIDEGTPFMTQGCRSAIDGFITCNRPYSNCTPFQAAKGELRNFPFPPTRDDIKKIRCQLKDYDNDSWIRPLEIADDFLLDDELECERQASSSPGLRCERPATRPVMTVEGQDARRARCKDS